MKQQINKVHNADLIGMSPVDKDFTLELKRKDEVIYRWKGYGGVFCFVEEINELSKYEINARSQRLMFGDHRVVLNAFDMLEKDKYSFMQKLIKLVGLGKEVD